MQSGVQGAVRARAGYAFSRLLTYAAGGVAFGGFSFQSNLASNSSALNAFYAVNNGQSVERVGWTIGGGAEWALNRRWSVRGEYRFSDFGKYHRRAKRPDFDARRILFRRASPGRESSSRSASTTNSAIRAPNLSAAPLVVKGPGVTADLRSPPPASQPASRLTD